MNNKSETLITPLRPKPPLHSQPGHLKRDLDHNSIDLGKLESGYMLFCEGLGNLRELRVLKVEFKGLDCGKVVLGDSLRNSLCKLQYLEVQDLSWRSIKVEKVSRWNAPGAVLSRHIRVLLLADYRFPILPTCIDIDSSLVPKLSDLSMPVNFLVLRT